MDPAHDLNEWSYHNPIAFCMPVQKGEHEGKHRLHTAHLRVTLRISRRWFKYAMNIVFIVVLLTFFGFSSYSIPLSNYADRASVTLTILLTMVAFMLVINDMIPTVPYLTWLDKYMLYSFSIVTAVGVEQTFSAALSEYWSDDGDAAPYGRPRITLEEWVFDIDDVLYGESIVQWSLFGFWVLYANGYLLHLFPLFLRP